VAAENNVENIVFCGDLFHEHGKLTADIVQIAFHKMAQLAATVPGECFLLVGNHDFLNRQGSINSASFLHGAGWNICYPEDHRVINGKFFRFMSYIPDQEIFEGMMEHINTLKGPTEYLFLHQGVDKVPVGSGFELPNEFLKPDMIPTNTLAFTGHYHRHQKVSDRLVIVGAPMQHTWSDSGEERGYIILDTDTNEWEFFAYERAPKFIKLKAKHGDIVDPETIVGNYIRLIDSESMDEALAVKEYLYSAGAASVEIVTKNRETVPSSKSQSFMSLDDAIKQFESDQSIEDKLSQLGKDLRSGTYGTTKYNN